MNVAAQTDFIAVDWGTSNLRAWAVDARGTVLDHVATRDGMGGLAPTAFEPALISAVHGWLSHQTPVIACGMVGARQGWHDVGYAAAPVRPADLRPVPVPAQDSRIEVAIVPGISQLAPPDVMRGEETQIAGYLSRAPDFDGVLCLPGTHTKWVHISAGEVVSFRTFMTGELFALAADHSVLRHSVGGDEIAAEAFAEAVSETVSRPERLAADLFSIRAAATLNGTPSAVGRARLSGLLIGAELAAARPYWLGQKVVVLGAAALSGLYQDALGAQGLSAQAADAQDATLRGLRHYRETMGVKSCT